MKAIIIKSFILFRRCKQLIIPYCLFHIAIVAHLIYLSNHFYVYQSMMATLKWAFHICIFGIGIFIYLGYELGVKLKEVHLYECIKTISNGYADYLCGIASVIFILVLPYLLVYLGFFILVYMASQTDHMPFLSQLIQYCLLYYGLSGLAGAFLGFFMSQVLGIKRFYVYTAALLILFINTNFTDPIFFLPYNLLYRAAPVIGQFLTNTLYELDNAFSLVPYIGGYGITFTFDDYYGLPIEPIRWIWPCSFILIVSFILLYKSSTRKNERNIAKIGIVILILIVIFSFNIRGSMLRLDLAGGYMFSDQHYYSDLESQIEQEPGFSIELYDINLKIRNELTARVSVELSSISAEHQSYVFTLYHGYHIHNIINGGGENVSYTRDRDTITIPLSEIDQKKTIVFTYSGDANKYYANRQAVSLPGYFPYYPMAGKRIIWLEEEQAINTGIPAETAVFHVKVDSALQIMSNLDGHDNQFSGEANSVSLFAGLIKQIRGNLFVSAITSCDISPDLVNDVSQQCNIICRILGIESPISDHIKLFIIPMNMMASSKTEACSVLGDHILTYVADPDEICQMILEDSISKTETNSALQRMFITYLVKKDMIRERYDQYVTQPEIHLLNIQKFAQMESRERFGNANETIYPAILYLCEYSPKKDSMPGIIYQYLISNTDQNFCDFLIDQLEEDIDDADH